MYCASDQYSALSSNVTAAVSVEAAMHGAGMVVKFWALGNKWTAVERDGVLQLKPIYGSTFSKMGITVTFVTVLHAKKKKCSKE